MDNPPDPDSDPDPEKLKTLYNRWFSADKIQKTENYINYYVLVL